MNVTSCEKKDNKVAELTVLVTPEEFEHALHESYKKNKGQMAVPGFRKGKAPRKIIENMYGGSVFYNDALDILLPTVCSNAVSESELRTVGYPQILDVSFGDDKTATVKFSVELYPEVTVSEYKGLTAVKPEIVIEDSEIDSEIAGVQLRNARIQTAERPAIGGDTAIIDFEGFVDGVAFEGGKGEDYELVLGSNSFIPGFEEKIQGMTVGEERDLDLVFPKDYKEDLAGKAVIFKVKIKEIKEKILPELDDEFAKDVSEFDTIEEYRNSIKEKITTTKTEEAQRSFEDNVLGKLADSIETDVPDAMIDESVNMQVENMTRQLTSYGMDMTMYLNMMGTNEEGFRANMVPGAIKQIKTTLALEKIAEMESVEPTDEEVEAYFEDLVTKYGVEMSVAKESVPKDAAIRELSLRVASKLVFDSAIAVAPEPEPEVKEESETKEAPKKPAAKAKKAKTTKTETPEVTESKTEEKTSEADKAELKKAPAKKPAAKKPAAKKAPVKKAPAKKASETTDK